MERDVGVEIREKNESYNDEHERIFLFGSREKKENIPGTKLFFSLFLTSAPFRSHGHSAPPQNH